MFLKVILTLTFLSFTFANFGSVIRSSGFNIFIFDIFSLISCILMTIYLVKRKKFIINLQFLLGNFFGFFCLFILFFSFSYFNFEENLKSFFYLIRFFLYFYNSYLIYILYKEKEIQLTFVKNLIFVNFLFLILLIIIQIIWFHDLSEVTEYGYDPHFGRVVGSFLDPNFLGFYLILYLWITTFIFPNKIVSLTSIFILLATQSRSALLTLFLFFGLWFLFKRNAESLIYALLTLAFVLLTPMLQKIEHFSRPNDSANLRLQSFENGLLISQFTDYMGIGFNNYKSYQKSLGLLEESRLNTNVSNFNDSSFISIYVFSGVFGVLIFMVFLISFIQNVSGFILLLIIIFNSNMNNSLFYPPTSFTIFLLMFMTTLGKQFFSKLKI